MVFTRFSGRTEHGLTNRLTDSLMDGATDTPENRMLLAPKVFGGEDIKYTANGQHNNNTGKQYSIPTYKTSLPKVIWEQGRVAAAVSGAGWHKGLRIRNVCIVFVKDRCANVRHFSVRKQE